MAEEIDPKELKKFGLTHYESKCYLSLLGQSRLSAVEVAKSAGVPRAKVYEILEGLVNKALCRSFPDKVNKYGAVNPIILKKKFESSLEALHTEIEEKNQKLDSIKKEGDEILEKLMPLYAEGRNKKDSLNYIEIIKNSEMIKERYLQLVERAREEILVFTKPPFDSTPEQAQEQGEQVLNVIKRKVSLRCIYEMLESDEKNRWLYNFIKWGIGEGEEARVIDKLPMKMAIFDRKTVLLALEDPVSKELSLTTQIVEHRALASGLRILFEVMWGRAEDYRILERLV
ncbi:MAG: TrmB family transcriptional regulator [Candidatus Zixiibacteriota bacterium]|nr:MAG: TrmB family transcriptional regulator [candidate division Zixibacteria bacterium]